MSKVLVVFGATGQQGGGLITYLLGDPELSQQYKIRAITRDVTSEKAKQLAEKVEVVPGDVSDRASLESALAGAHTIFAMTAPSLAPFLDADRVEVEYNSIKTMADVAVEKGVQYFILSTLPPVKDISGGKYTKVTPFDAKAAAERYIRTLPIKSAFYCPGSFMENFQSQIFLAPKPAGDGTYVMTRHHSAETQFPLVHAVGNTGNFVGAILANPEKYEGKTFAAATRFYSMNEIVSIMSKATGKTIVYKQVSVEEFKEDMGIPEVLADIFVEAFSYGEEFGYYGPDSEKLVAWAAANARGRLSTLEEYFEAHPLQLA